jgi:hypothetical protein
MPPGVLFEPWRFTTELVYTLIVLGLCGLIYFRTREIYEISRYEGIRHFRNAFLFFGLAYVSRFLLHLIMISSFALEIDMRHRLIHFAFLALTGYFSTMAIFQIIYCTAWKRISYLHFLVFSNAIALLFSVISILTRSPQMLTLLQALLLILGAILIYVGRKGHSKARGLYMLTMALWLLNLYILSPRWMIAFEAKAALQVVSVVVFSAIYYKVSKWAR